MPFSVPCHLCTKKFKTSDSLWTHSVLRHKQRNIDIVQFLDGSGNPCEQPKAAALTEEELEDYFKWLGVLLEWINGSLVRDHPDKFLPCNMFILFDLNLHLIIFSFLERKMVSCWLPSSKAEVLYLHAPLPRKLYAGQCVCDVPHLCQLIFKRKAWCFSYKIFNEETFEWVLEEPNILQFCPLALFRNSDEVPDVSEMPALHILGNLGSTDKRVTAQGQLKILTLTPLHINMASKD